MNIGEIVLIIVAGLAGFVIGIYGSLSLLYLIFSALEALSNWISELFQEYFGCDE